MYVRFGGECRKTYHSDMARRPALSLPKYIIGAESLDSYEDFVSQLEDLGIRECLDIYAAAYQRYKAR